jgi:hypothetical protein
VTHTADDDSAADDELPLTRELGSASYAAATVLRSGGKIAPAIWPLAHGHARRFLLKHRRRHPFFCSWTTVPRKGENHGS